MALIDAKGPRLDYAALYGEARIFLVRLELAREELIRRVPESDGEFRRIRLELERLAEWREIHEKAIDVLHRLAFKRAP